MTSILKKLNLTEKEIEQLDEEITLYKLDRAYTERAAVLKNCRKLVGRAFEIRAKRQKESDPVIYMLVIDAMSDLEGNVEVLRFESEVNIRRSAHFSRYIKTEEDLYMTTGIRFLQTDRMKVNGDGSPGKMLGYYATEISKDEFWEKAQLAFEQLRPGIAEVFFSKKEDDQYEL